MVISPAAVVPRLVVPRQNDREPLVATVSRLCWVTLVSEYHWTISDTAAARELIWWANPMTVVACSGRSVKSAWLLEATPVRRAALPVRPVATMVAAPAVNHAP